MILSKNFPLFFPAVLCGVLFMTVVIWRPVLPIDETRYLTVAWEMFLNKNYFLPTMNFGPYHHKPPLMFWLINGSWNVFGVSRASAMVPFFLAALALIALTVQLAKQLFPERPVLHTILPVMVIGSAPFLIYSTVVMFDILMSVFILGFLVTVLSFAERPTAEKILIAGACLGLAGLTKGPVVLVHTLLPMMFYSAWKVEKHCVSGGMWSGALLGAVLVGLCFMAFWLLNMVALADSDFLYNLLWKQTAGRVTGDMESSHARPLYFYVPFIPVLFLPWALFPEFWRRGRNILQAARQKGAERFLLIWVLSAFALFSVISGKQPHYLVPLFPPVVILIGLCLENLKPVYFKAVSFVAVLVFVCAHIWAASGLFKKYDLAPLAEYVGVHQDHDWAFVRKYQGELGFLGRLHKPLTSMNLDELEPWFKAHPAGYAVVRHAPKPEIVDYEALYTRPYRDKAISIYRYNPVQKGD